MYWLRTVLTAALFVGALSFRSDASEFGRAAMPADINVWDIDVRADGKGLPGGRGTVSQGRSVYDENCAACHGANGRDGIKDRLAGGQGSLTSDNPIKTIGSFWPYATTLFDYIHRAMPYQAPGSLTVDETYAVAAYLLSLNGILPPDGSLDQDSLPQVKMPNRDGFVPDPEFGPRNHGK